MLMLHPHPLLVDRSEEMSKSPPQVQSFDRSPSIDNRITVFCISITLLIGAALLANSFYFYRSNFIWMDNIPQDAGYHTKTTLNRLVNSKLMKVTMLVLNRAEIIAHSDFRLIVEDEYKSWFESQGWKSKPLSYDWYGGGPPRKISVSFTKSLSQSKPHCDRTVKDVAFFYNACRPGNPNSCYNDNIGHIH